MGVTEILLDNPSNEGERTSEKLGFGKKEAAMGSNISGIEEACFFFKVWLVITGPRNKFSRLL